MQIDFAKDPQDLTFLHSIACVHDLARCVELLLCRHSIFQHSDGSLAQFRCSCDIFTLCFLIFILINQDFVRFCVIPLSEAPGPAVFNHWIYSDDSTVILDAVDV